MKLERQENGFGGKDAKRKLNGQLVHCKEQKEKRKPERERQEMKDSMSESGGTPVAV